MTEQSSKKIKSLDRFSEKLNLYLLRSFYAIPLKKSTGSVVPKFSATSWLQIKS
jgi:hypothetical protein